MVLALSAWLLMYPMNICSQNVHVDSRIQGDTTIPRSVLKGSILLFPPRARTASTRKTGDNLSHDPAVCI
jgi:hypothetical protein